MTRHPAPPVADGHARTSFDPAVHGFDFPNAFVNTIVRLPGGKSLRTAGRCGGMAALALDHAAARRPAPHPGPDAWAPGRVPPDGNPIADALLRRQVRTFLTPSALRFLTWSLLPDDDVLVLPGVVRSTVTQELPRLVAELRAGRPRVIGLVVARGLGAAGRNHQVVALGYERRPGRTTVDVYDPNSPGRTVHLRRADDEAGWTASNGPTWRGFFVHDVAPRPLPAGLTGSGR